MKVNLLPPAPPLVRVRVWAFTLSAALLLAACAWLGAQWFGARAMWKAETATLAEQALALSGLQARLAAAKTAQSQVAVVRAVQALQAQFPDPARSMQALLAVLPPRARVTSLEYQNGVLQGVVSVDSLQAAASFIRGLERSDALHDVSITSVASAGANGAATVTFSAKVPGSATGVQANGG